MLIEVQQLGDGCGLQIIDSWHSLCTNIPSRIFYSDLFLYSGLGPRNNEWVERNCIALHSKAKNQRELSRIVERWLRFQYLQTLFTNFDLYKVTHSIQLSASAPGAKTCLFIHYISSVVTKTCEASLSYITFPTPFISTDKEFILVPYRHPQLSSEPEPQGEPPTATSMHSL